MAPKKQRISKILTRSLTTRRPVLKVSEGFWKFLFARYGCHLIPGKFALEISERLKSVLANYERHWRRPANNQSVRWILICWAIGILNFDVLEWESQKRDVLVWQLQTDSFFGKTFMCSAVLVKIANPGLWVCNWVLGVLFPVKIHWFVSRTQSN